MSTGGKGGEMLQLMQISDVYMYVCRFTCRLCVCECGCGECNDYVNTNVHVSEVYMYMSIRCAPN